MRQVLITGASSDIGLAACRKFLDAGWRVLAHYRSERAELNDIREPQLQKWQCDFSSIGNLQSDLEDDKFGISKSDAFISLAANISPTEFLKATPCDILNALNINLIPGLLIAQFLGPKMISRNFGRIIHGSSIGVKFGGGQQSFAYSLSKHAQEFIPRECRSWANNGVFMNVVRIGVTNTRLHQKTPHKDMVKRAELIPAGRLASSEEVADTLFWLGSDKNGFITNEIISISGGE